MNRISTGSGKDVSEIASVELPGIKGLWALRGRSSDVYDKYLVSTFLGETRALAFEGEELGEIEIAGFDRESQTLLCANMANDLLVQVTDKKVILVSCERLVDKIYRSCACKRSMLLVLVCKQ